MSDREAQILLGRISGVFGLKGWVKVFSFTDPREAILKYQPWLLGPERKTVQLLQGQPHGKTLIAALPGVTTPEQARTLVGQEIWLPRANLPGPGERTWYWSDLVGLAVRNVEGTDLGVVHQLLETGANDVLVVKGDRERLIPFVLDSVVREVNLAEQRLLVDWHEDD